MAAAKNFVLLLGFGAWLFAAPALAQPAGDTVDTAGDTVRAGPAPASLIPFPIVFYQPETGFGFGGSVIYLFTLGGRPSESGRSLRSSLSATAIYTAKQQFLTSVETEMYPGGGRYRVMASASFAHFPNTFWGIGNDTPESLEEDYTPDLLNASGEFGAEVASHLYAGAFAQAANRRLTETIPGGLIATGAVPGTEDGTLLTLGLMLTRDSRSSNVFPVAGEYHQVRVGRVWDVSGNGNDFSTYSLDLRFYAPLRSGVVAFRALGIASRDVPPFDLTPQLGGQSLLRGYYGGRFRDRSLVAIEAEYRSPLWRRMRGVVFGGAGEVADVPGDMRFDALHPSAGVGLRVLLSRKEEFHLRADYGIGFDFDSSGLYLGFGEVF